MEPGMIPASPLAAFIAPFRVIRAVVPVEPAPDRTGDTGPARLGCLTAKDGAGRPAGRDLGVGLEFLPASGVVASEVYLGEDHVLASFPVSSRVMVLRIGHESTGTG